MHGPQPAILNQKVSFAKAQLQQTYDTPTAYRHQVATTAMESESMSWLAKIGVTSE